ncbi:MAG: hypothetical protein P8L31_06145 [Pseudomonadales bacterium]|jgi:hypothetical protein|nr:hypothetical protein [Pseudomonadales bacterium]
MPTDVRNASLLRSFLSAIAGFSVYGGWAYYVNADHGTGLATMIGLVQGGYSFVLTFVMTLVTEWLFKRFTESKNQVAYVMITILIALFTMPYVIHVFIGTPAIWMTILPGFAIGAMYTGLYVFGLKKIDRVKEDGYRLVERQKQEGFHERRSTT